MKVIILKKKSLIAGALIICFAILFVVSLTRLIPAAVEAATSTQARKLPIYCVDKSEKVVSLTFDAAWGNVIIGNRTFPFRQVGSTEKCLKILVKKGKM